MTTRGVLRLYAGVTIAMGIAMHDTGVRGIEGVPLLHQSLLWILGRGFVAVGCAAFAISLNPDPQSRRRALALFAGGHLVLGVSALDQWRWSLRELGLPWSAVLAPLLAGGVLLTAAVVAWIHAQRVGMSASRQVGSAYDEHIRRIARREERARLARDLHDAVKQQLFVIQTAAATTQARFDSDAAGAREALQHVRAAAREATTEMEALLEELQAAPIESAGLVEALKKQCEAVGLRTGAEVSFQHGALPPQGRLAPGAHEALYRVAQEALANVAKHARASRVDVSLHATASEVELKIVDNGSGFDPRVRRHGMGLRNMETRATELGGRVSVEAGSAGTTVTLVMPVTSATARSVKIGVAVSVLVLIHYLTFSLLIGDRISVWQLLLFASTGLSVAIFLRTRGTLPGVHRRWWV